MAKIIKYELHEYFPNLNDGLFDADCPFSEFSYTVHPCVIKRNEFDRNVTILFMGRVSQKYVLKQYLIVL